MTGVGLPGGIERAGSGEWQMLVHGPFAEASGVRHGFSMKTSGRLPGPEAAGRAAGLGEAIQVAGLHQVHGARVVARVPASESGTVPDEEVADTADRPRADGHLTADPSVALAIQSADCVPVLVADRRKNRVGAAHAGWKGTSLEIAGVLVGRMIAAGSRAGDLVALLGPAIGPCCYEVGEEVISVFRAGFPEGAGFLAPGARAGHAQLDLVAANTATLRSAGIPAARIYCTGLCTACRTDLFPSWRREGPSCGRMWSLIAPAGL